MQVASALRRAVVRAGSISVEEEGRLSGQLVARGGAQPYLQVPAGAGLRNLTGPERTQIGEPGEEIYDCGHSKVRVSSLFLFFFCEMDLTAR